VDVENGRQVEERARDRRDRDAVDVGDLVGRKAGLGLVSPRRPTE
jgi:hypothetical protein